MLEQAGVTYADLFEPLAREREELNFKRDSHWNNRGAASPQLFDICLTLADQSKLELFDFGFDDVDEAELCIEDEVVFVKY